MSIQLNNVTKLFGSQKAVDDVSFSIGQGEIVGFLGPNGAGKSTTMKMITGYFEPTEGDIEVSGIDVIKDSLGVRSRIGYLPESNPLYPEMYIREYLKFISDVHKVENKKRRIDEVIELTGLTKEANKKLGQLSKGYKQRVGLAQAIIHDPEVLILDEPISGLDPNQLIEIRDLIRSFGEEKTIVFSSHIMQEVQAISDRVIIINDGQIVADDPIDVLTKKVSGKSYVVVRFEQDPSIDELMKIKNISDVKALTSHQFELYHSAEFDIRADIFDWAVQQNNRLLSMQETQHSVEDVFRELTVA